jgi:hypothetical protein
MLDDATKMLAYHERTIGNIAIPIFQHAVKEDPEFFIEAWAQITVAVDAMCEAIVLFDTQLGNISHLVSGQATWKTDMERGRRQRVPKE